MHAAIYGRLSKNRAGLSDNIEIQIAECHAYADEKSWPVVVVESDDDISASKFSKKPRPGYDALIQSVEAGQIEVIICTEMTRLYRRLEELLELIKMAERTGLRGIWTTDNIGYDLSTPEGVHGAIAAINNAQLESAKLSKRIKRKKAVRAREGMTNGGGRPFGYEPDGMTLRDSEVKLLLEAKDRYIAGETMRDIVRDYYARGVVSPYGKPWNIMNFQRVLFSKRYLGIRTHNDAEYPAKWPAIFTQTEWELMNARRLSRIAKYPGKTAGQGRQYLLTGLVYCGRCGTYMIGSRRSHSAGYQRRYRCRAIDSHGLPLGCGRIFRAAEPLDAWITEAVLYRFDTPEVARALSSAAAPDRMDELIFNHRAAKLKLDAMVRDYASGFLSRDEFAVAKTVAEQAVHIAREELSKYQDRSTQALLPAKQTIRDAWEGASLDWRHSVIKLIVERIVVHEGHPGSHVYKGWRFDPDAIEVVWRV
jgi:site-specific DNA recombinase